MLFVYVPHAFARGDLSVDELTRLQKLLVVGAEAISDKVLHLRSFDALALAADGRHDEDGRRRRFEARLRWQCCWWQ